MSEIGMGMGMGMGMPEDWHKRLALQLALQLPKNQADTDIVLSLLRDLSEKWLFTSQIPSRPSAPVLHFPAVRSQDAG
jgi:hypothetical protein